MAESERDEGVAAAAAALVGAARASPRSFAPADLLRLVEEAIAAPPPPPPGDPLELADHHGAEARRRAMLGSRAADRAVSEARAGRAAQARAAAAESAAERAEAAAHTLAARGHLGAAVEGILREKKEQ